MPRGQQADSQAASSACSVTACDNRGKLLTATTDAALGRPQQAGQQSAALQQRACSCAEGGARAALSADRAPECVTPEAAEQGLPLFSAPLPPLLELAQEAPAATSRLQDMPGLLLPPELQTTGHSVPSRFRFRNASGAGQTGSAAAGAGQSGAQQRC